MSEKTKLSVLKPFERELVLAFIEYTREGDLDDLPLEMLHDLAREVKIPAALRRGAIDKLCDMEIFEQVKNHFDEVFISLHPSFYDDAVRIYFSGSPQNQAENSWQPLQLDRSTSAAKAAIEATEALLEAVRGDNGLASTEPETHGSLVWSLRTGLDAVKKHAPTKDQIGDLLKKPIEFIVKRFAGAVLGDLADKAAHALSVWLGPFF